MSDAAMKVDPDFYNRRLLDADANGLEQSRNALPRGGGGAGSMGGSAPIGMMGGGGGGGYDGDYVAPDLPDYLVRQHSLLGLYLSLNPTDEADAERNWGFPQQQRAAIAAVTVVVPLFLALFLTGGWLWKVCTIGVAIVAARLTTTFVLNRYPDVEVTVQGHNLAVWPHFTVGTLATVLLIWFVTAAASSTGWSTMWLCFRALLFWACLEAALRGGMWHFRWWTPAQHFSFLKPWGAYNSTVGGQQQHPQASSYAPPRPVPIRSDEYTGGIGGGVGGGGGGGGAGGGVGGGAKVGGNNAGSEKTALLEKNNQTTLEDEIDNMFQESV